MYRTLQKLAEMRTRFGADFAHARAAFADQDGFLAGPRDVSGRSAKLSVSTVVP